MFAICNTLHVTLDVQTHNNAFFLVQIGDDSEFKVYEFQLFIYRYILLSINEIFYFTKSYIVTRNFIMLYCYINSFFVRSI